MRIVAELHVHSRFGLPTSPRAGRAAVTPG